MRYSRLYHSRIAVEKLSAEPNSLKQRLDMLLVERQLCESRQQAQRLIRAGEVMVNQQVIDKPGTEVKTTAQIQVKERSPYVSRGGEKLAKALTTFPIQVKQRICLDGGISTGGFTDCLLQAGAQRVYGVDVGYGQVAWSLRQDPRVILRERTNIRYLLPEELYALASAPSGAARLDPDAVDPDAVDPDAVNLNAADLNAADLNSEPQNELEPSNYPLESQETQLALTYADLGVMDVSFISLTKVLPAFWQLLQSPREVVLLVKPQFEVGRAKVGKKGVVRDPKDQAEAILQVCQAAAALGWQFGGLTWSPLAGPAGNIEYLLWLSMQADLFPDLATIQQVTEAAQRSIQSHTTGS